MNINLQNYGDTLIDLAFKAEGLLKKYIQFHDKRIKLSGTFISLFRKINFEEIYTEIDLIYQSFEEFNSEITSNKKDYPEYSAAQQDFYDSLVSYFSALYEAVGTLHLIVGKQYELSKGWKNSKLTLADNMKLENIYKEKIMVYMGFGEKLNQSFKSMQKEAKDNFLS